jgi:hypothetical protein
LAAASNTSLYVIRVPRKRVAGARRRDRHATVTVRRILKAILPESRRGTMKIPPLNAKAPLYNPPKDLHTSNGQK